MSKNTLLLALLVLAAGFGISLLVVTKTAKEEKQVATVRISGLSNDLVQTQGKLDEQKSVNVSLEGQFQTLQTNFSVLQRDAATASNRLSVTESALSSTRTDLEKSQAETKTASELAAANAAEVAKRDARIKELEGENDDLTKKMGELNTALDGLERQISETERKLTASEGDRDFLLKELKRLQAEKAELERQFNDLAVLKEQVHKLKEELSVARRLDWIRRGIYGNRNVKGAEALTRSVSIPGATQEPAPTTSVEIRQSGGITIQQGTNAPVAVPPAPKP